MEDDSFIFIVIFLHHVRRMRLNVMKPRRCLFITTKSFFTMKKDFELTGTDRSVDVSLPENWCFCFDDGCKLAEKCFRRFAAVHLAGGRQSGMAVFRGMGDDGVCDFFLEKRIERQAWGMDKLFEKVFYNDARSIRKALLGYLASRGVITAATVARNASRPHSRRGCARCSAVTDTRGLNSDIMWIGTGLATEGR